MLFSMLLAVLGCGSRSPEARLRSALASQTTGMVKMPSGVIEVSSELALAPGAHDLEIVGSGTTLKATGAFHGRAMIVAEGAKHIAFRNFSVNGNREEITRPPFPPLAMAPPENYFRVWYPNNGLLMDRVDGLEISGVAFSGVVNFPVLVSRSQDIRISGVSIEKSGSLNALGRNNLTGGILIEEGSSRFEVRDSTFRDIRGNALWTHSLRISPRLEEGLFTGNQFANVGRDAIQVGHATRVRVENNRGTSIGFPAEVVDAENGGIPAAIDTAGSVDASVYSGNRFEEVNGQCIDLDGFHDGAVRDNQCVNRAPPGAYAFGHFGIVMNNTDPGANSGNIEITGNVLDGMKYGAIYFMGSGNRVTGNRFLHVNTAGCNETKAFSCIYKADEPKLMESGIYLSRGFGRAEPVQGNLIRDNVISGHGMKALCIALGPEVSAAQNKIGPNQCSDGGLE
jgi:hypothetical protein